MKTSKLFHVTFDKVIFLISLFVISINPNTVFSQSNDLNQDGVEESMPRILSENEIVVPISTLDTGDVVHTIPAPGTHCQGLTWDGEHLWVTDNTTKMIYKISPEDGEVISSFPFPISIKFSEGLAWDGTNLWGAGWNESNGNGSKIFKLDPSNGELLFSFYYPGEDTWPHGITYDGQHIWANNFLHDTINSLDKFNPENGDYLGSIPAPGEKSLGLTWIGSFLWSNDYELHRIYQIDPNNGTIIYSFSCYAGILRDMTWDGEYMWSLSWSDATIYKLDIGPAAIILNKNEAIELSIYPNPFSNRVTISFSLADSEKIKLDLFSITGQKIKALANKQLPSGNYNFSWDARKKDGGLLKEGVYFVRLQYREQVIIKKVIFSR